MKKKIDIVQLLFIIALVILIIELFFDGPALLISFAIFGAMAFYGRKMIDKLRGKLLFWVGVIGAVLTTMNLIAFKFLLLAVIISFFVKWYDRRKEPAVFQPRFLESEPAGGEKVIQETPLFYNKWFGRQETESTGYGWQDVNIQAGIGDTVIDMTNTILPKDDAVIVIRNVIGNIEILVPYETEVSIDHSVVYGSIDIFGHEEESAWNRALHIRTEQYHEATHKVKIFTSMLTGKLEVKRK